MTSSKSVQGTQELQVGQAPKEVQNGRTPKEQKETSIDIFDDGNALVNSRDGMLFYVQGDDKNEPGIYVKNGNRKPYPILNGIITVDGISTSSPATYSFTFTSLTDKDISISIDLTREKALHGEYGKVSSEFLTPSDSKECALAWKALRVLALKNSKSDTSIKRRGSIRTLGWTEDKEVWVRVNGYITASHVTQDERIAASIPSHWPQSLPENIESLPTTIDASVIERLYTFWPESITRFPFSLFGACSFVMQPVLEGTPRWELELFGMTGWLKTTYVNWMFRLFFGAKYSHSTETQLLDIDSVPGRGIGCSLLPYHAYMTYDHNQQPGSDRYEKQQKDRVTSIDASGNGDKGPLKSEIDGQTLSYRPARKGLLMRLGETNPHIYTVHEQLASTDARAMTFLITEDSQAYKNNLDAASRWIQLHERELDAIGIMHVQYLAQGTIKDKRERWEVIEARAKQLVACEDTKGVYHMRHARRIEQLENTIAGVLSFCQFLRDVDSETGNKKSVYGAAQLAQRIENAIPASINERLDNSHDLMKLYEDARGGASTKHTQATIILASIRDRLTQGDFYLTRFPDNFPVSSEYLCNSQRKYGAIQLGCISKDGKYLAVDKDPLETLARQLARADKRVRFINLNQLLADLKSVGAIVGGNKDNLPYVHQVRIGEKVFDERTGEVKEKRPYLVCFPVEQVWPDHFEQKRKRLNAKKLGVTSVTSVTSVTKEHSNSVNALVERLHENSDNGQPVSGAENAHFCHTNDVNQCDKNEHKNGVFQHDETSTSMQDDSTSVSTQDIENNVTLVTLVTLVTPDKNAYRKGDETMQENNQKTLFTSLPMLPVCPTCKTNTHVLPSIVEKGGFKCTACVIQFVPDRKDS